MGLADQLARKGKGFIEPVSNPLADRVTELEKEVAALRSLVTQLSEREPTVTKSGNAMTAAEKQRAYRARLKAGKKESTNA